MDYNVIDKLLQWSTKYDFYQLRFIIARAQVLENCSINPALDQTCFWSLLVRDRGLDHFIHFKHTSCLCVCILLYCCMKYCNNWVKKEHLSEVCEVQPGQPGLCWFLQFGVSHLLLLRWENWKRDPLTSPDQI